MTTTLTANTRISIEELSKIAERAGVVLSNLRDDLLDPWPRKMAPMITSTRLAALCGIDRTQLNYLCTKADRGNYPVGTLASEKRRTRMFTLAEAQEFVRVHGKMFKKRPGSAKAPVIGVGNFKGGVGKTTMAVALAQGLTLLGYRVLLVDLDPQASATTLMGYVPDAEVTEEMTVMPVVYGDQPDLLYAVKESYWDGLDLIPSCPALFGADFFLPNKQASDPSFEFWTVLDKALDPLRDTYDVIVIDTPPTLSYLAIGSFMASDGILVPLPPETLDYASSTQFFKQFGELFNQLQSTKKLNKNFEFIRIFLSKVKLTSPTTPVVREWIRKTYHELVSTAEIIDFDVVRTASSEFKTVYDLSTETFEGSSKTLARAVDSFDAMVAEVAFMVANAWQLRESEREAAHVEG